MRLLCAKLDDFNSVQQKIGSEAKRSCTCYFRQILVKSNWTTRRRQSRAQQPWTRLSWSPYGTSSAVEKATCSALLRWRTALLEHETDKFKNKHWLAQLDLLCQSPILYGGGNKINFLSHTAKKTQFLQLTSANGHGPAHSFSRSLAQFLSLRCCCLVAL